MHIPLESYRHGTALFVEALSDAAARTHHRPYVVHSDQGSEYLAQEAREYVASLGAQSSYSARSSPWQNGFQEGFYSQFKKEIGDLDRFPALGVLLAEIYRYIAYYNECRIHSKLKVPPATYRQQHLAHRANVLSKNMGS
jgi:transposase InsO family protein